MPSTVNLLVSNTCRLPSFSAASTSATLAAVPSAASVQIGDGNGAILIALAPVLGDAAVLGTLDQLLVADAPHIGGGGQRGGGGGGEHVDVVTDRVADLAGILQLLGGGGGTGGVGVLADDDRTVGDQASAAAPSLSMSNQELVYMTSIWTSG